MQEWRARALITFEWLSEELLAGAPLPGPLRATLVTATAPVEDLPGIMHAPLVLAGGR